MIFFPLSEEPWLIVKLVFVFSLFLYHLSCGYIFKAFSAGNYKYSSMQLRIWNEVATIFLVSIVFLVELKEILGLWYGLGGLFSLMIILGLGIKIYRKNRLKSENKMDKKESKLDHIENFTKEELKEKDDQFWRDNLTPLQYEVTRKAATEHPRTGFFDQFNESGEYFLFLLWRGSFQK